MEIYYHLIQRRREERPFDENIEYCLEVPYANKEGFIEYLYRLYKLGENIYITDIFPRMYADDENCFQRFTSHEGFAVNMRQLSVCCLNIFIKDFIAKDRNSVMVVSGSYGPHEPNIGPSRKLRIYCYIFNPLLETNKLNKIEIFDENALLLYSKHANIEPDSIKKQYIDFKKRQKQ